MKILRIGFCILSCLLFAASVILGIFFGLVWFAAGIVAAAACAVAMFLIKDREERPAEHKPDFMDPPKDGTDGSDKPAE